MRFSPAVQIREKRDPVRLPKDLAERNLTLNPFVINEEYCDKETCLHYYAQGPEGEYHNLSLKKTVGIFSSVDIISCKTSSIIFLLYSRTCLHIKACKCISWENCSAKMFHLQRPECLYFFELKLRTIKVVLNVFINYLQTVSYLSMKNGENSIT